MMAYNNFKYTKDNFLSSTRGIVMLYQPKDGGDALRPEYMLEALQIHKNLTETLVGEVRAGPDQWHTVQFYQYN